MSETKGCSFACDQIGGVVSSEAFISFIVMFEVRDSKDSAGKGTRDDGAVGKIIGDFLVDPGGGAVHGVQA